MTSGCLCPLYTLWHKSPDSKKHSVSNSTYKGKNVRLPLGIHTAVINIQSDKVSRRLTALRCGKCPYRRKDWAEFPQNILTDKILSSRQPLSSGSGYIFVMGGLKTPNPTLPNLPLFQTSLCFSVISIFHCFLQIMMY